MTHPADSEQIKQVRTKAGFLSLLAKTHHVARSVEHYRTSEIAPLTTRANSSRLDRCWGPGWVAAGDASISFDPPLIPRRLQCTILGDESRTGTAVLVFGVTSHFFPATRRDCEKSTASTCPAETRTTVSSIVAALLDLELESS